MLRRNLRLRTDDLNELRVKPVPTWCTSHEPQSHGKGKGKAKQSQNNNKPKQTTTFKKKNKEDEGYFVCGSPNHWVKKCSTRKVRKLQPE
jgi:hypothetical protein